MSEKTKVWVCILTHNRSEMLHTFLTMPAFVRAIEQYGPENVTVVIQAQGCTDDTWSWLGKGVPWLPCEVMTFNIDFNLWAIGGRHRLIEWLVYRGGLHGDDVVIFLDDDIRIVGGDWIQMFMAWMRSPVGAVGIDGKIFNPGWHGHRSIMADANNRVPKTWHEKPCPNSPWPMPVDVVGGGWMAVKGMALLSGANYDLDQLPFWGGDDDFCLQIRELGYEVLSLGPQEVSGLCHEPAHAIPDEMWHDSQRRLIKKWRGKHVALEADR